MASLPTPGFEQPESIPLDEQGNIAADVSCLVCGYNLRTQPLQGRCPECGTAVGRSAHGDLLRYCEPGWVETLAGGMDWIVAGITSPIWSLVLIVRYRRAFNKAAQDARSTWAASAAVG